MQNLNRDNKCLKFLIANTIVNHIFHVLGDVKESRFGITTYLTFRWQFENCRFCHKKKRRRGRWREREGTREAIILKWTIIKRHELGHIIECDLAWLINYLQNNVKRGAFKRKCVKWSITFNFLLIVQNYTTRHVWSDTSWVQFSFNFISNILNKCINRN